MILLRRIVNIRPGEGKPVLILFSYFFTFVAVSITGSAARDAYFLNLFDRSYLPLMYVAVAVVMTGIIFLYTRLARDMDLITVIQITTFISAASLTLIKVNLQGWVIPVLYVWMEIIVGLMITQFWFLAGDVFDARQAKRLFSLISGGGAFAAIVIGAGIKPFVLRFGSDQLLWATVGFLLVTLLPVSLIRPHRKKTPGISEQIPAKPITRRRQFDPYLISIAVVVGLAAFVSKIVDYQFKITSVAFFPVQDDLVNFFGLFYAATGLATLIMQFFITGRVLSRFGVLSGLIILPIALMAGSAAFLLSPILIYAFLVKFSDQVFKFSVHSASMQLLWFPIPALRKQRSKPVIDGSIRTLLEGLAGIAIFISIKFVPIQFLSLFILGGILIWLFTSLSIKTGYIHELKSALEKRQLDFQELNLDVTDPTMVKTLEKALQSDQEIQQDFVLELIQDLPLTPWKDSLIHLLESGSKNIRRTVFKMVANNRDILSDSRIIELIQSDDEFLAAEALSQAGIRKLKTMEPILIEKLTFPDIRISAAAAQGILLLGTGPMKEATLHLVSLLDSNNEKEQVLALQHLETHPKLLDSSKIARFLEQGPPKVRIAALSLAKTRLDSDLIPSIVHNLAESSTAPIARQVLKDYPVDQVMKNFNTLSGDTLLSTAARIGIIRTLRSYPTHQSLEILLSVLEQEDPKLIPECINSLLVLARKITFPDTVHKRLDHVTRREAKSIYTCYQILNLLPKTDGTLLQDHLLYEIKSRLPGLLKLGVMDTPDIPIETYIHMIEANDIHQLPLLLELFDQIYSTEERGLVTPLVEPNSIAERSEIGRQQFPDLPSDGNQVLKSFVTQSNPWRSIVALDYALAQNLDSVISSMDWEKVPVSPFHREWISKNHESIISLASSIPMDRFKLSKEKTPMYTTLEKTLHLKTVSLFQTIPGEDLSRIAQIAEEIQVPTGTTIFKEDDYGDSLFIVIDGQVEIHHDGRHIATLSQGDCLGEMALLDQEPRSADATVTEDAILLKIAQEGFFELMSGNMEIMQGVVKLLTGRLRKAIH